MRRLRFIKGVVTAAWLVAVMWLLVLCQGCRAHKEVASREVTQVTHVTQAGGLRSMERDVVEEAVEARCDSLVLAFSADSVVTAEAVIYRPSVSVGVSAPTVESGIRREESGMSEVAMETEAVCEIEEATEYEDSKQWEKPTGVWKGLLLIVVGGAVILLVRARGGGAG